LLPPDEKVKNILEETVNELLRDELDKLDLRTQSPVCQFHNVIDDGDSEDRMSDFELQDPSS